MHFSLLASCSHCPCVLASAIPQPCASYTGLPLKQVADQCAHYCLGAPGRHTARGPDPASRSLTWPQGAAAHGCASDWWALGVLTYELLYARSPFRGPTQERTMYNITTRAVDFPASLRVSARAKQFMRAMLRQRVEHRLGSSVGVAELMGHPWFEGVAWDQVPGFVAELMPSNVATAPSPSPSPSPPPHATPPPAQAPPTTS